MINLLIVLYSQHESGQSLLQDMAFGIQAPKFGLPGLFLQLVNEHEIRSLSCQDDGYPDIYLKLNVQSFFRNSVIPVPQVSLLWLFNFISSFFHKTRSSDPSHPIPSIFPVHSVPSSFRSYFLPFLIPSVHSFFLSYFSFRSCFQ